MGQHHSLGATGRAARIRENDHIFGRVDGDRRQRPVMLEECPKRCCAIRLAKDEDLLDLCPGYSLPHRGEPLRHGEDEARSGIDELRCISPAVNSGLSIVVAPPSEATP